ncbi:MAG TPA: hypothetical protein VGD61_18475 [Pyrinomonadaceae bacterium]
MSRRQTEGGETWRRLKEWSRSQTASERLAAQLLRSQGYKEVDPSHPLGGKDGLKDTICSKDGVKFVGASYFPRGQKRISAIKKKFQDDLQGVAKNNAQGFAFVTNQELTVGQRTVFQELAGTMPVDLFHLERVAQVLDTPSCYGIRLEFLDIEMTKEEQLSFLATVGNFTERIEHVCGLIDLLRAEVKNLIPSEKPKPTPKGSVSLALNLARMWDTLKKCSHCGYSYRVEGGTLSMLSGGFSGGNIVNCPNCGNAETV